MTVVGNRLRLRLLGPFDAGEFRLPTRKAEALLAHLALEAGIAHRRESLMTLLWGDRTENQARHSLSQTLFSIRKLLGENADCLVADGDAIMLSPDRVTVDALEFEKLAENGDLPSLEAATRLWRGELLQGLNLKEFGYQEWVTRERIRLKEKALAVLSRLCQAHEADGANDAAVQAALRLLSLDPLLESTHRTLMRLYLALGRPEAALRQFDHCAEILERELGEEPEAETRQLRADILRRRRMPVNKSPPPKSGGTQCVPPLNAPDFQAEAVRPLSGRGEELRGLQDHLAEALAGRQRLAFVTGEPGIGKTTLVDAFLAGAGCPNDGLLIGRGQCMDLRGPGEPFMPVLEILGTLCRASADVCSAIGTHAPSWLPFLPSLGSSADGDANGLGTRERMLRELLDAIEAVAAVHPLLLVLEDLHWSDCSTLDFVESLVRRRGAFRIMVLGTCRVSNPNAAMKLIRDLQGRGMASIVSLSPMDMPSVRDYVAARYPDASPPETFLEILTSRSGGNPLFLGNLIDWWINQGHLDVENGMVLRSDVAELERGLPDTLAFLVDDQVDRLDPEERDSLLAAGVVGVAFSASAVAAARSVDPERTEDVLDGLERAGILIRRTGESVWPNGVETSVYAFEHQLYRDALYRRLTRSARRRMHQAVGLFLESAHAASKAPPAVEIAMHFAEGGDPARAVRNLERAAVQGLKRGAHRDAVAQLDRALQLLPQLEETDRDPWELRLQTARAPALVATKGFHACEPESAYRRICELAQALDDRKSLSSGRFGLAAINEFRGHYLETQQLLQEQEADAGESPDASIQVACAELMACSTFHNAKFAEAIQESERSLRAYVAERDLYVTAALGENPLVSCHCWAGRSLWFLGNTEEAVARLDTALREAEAEGHWFAQALAHEHMARLRQHMGEASSALGHARKAVALGEDYGFPYRVASGLVLCGWARTMLGDPPEGLAEIERGLTMCRELGAAIEYPYFLALQAEALQAAGRPGAGLAVLEEARKQSQGRQGFFYGPEILRLIGRLRLPGDEPGAAEAFEAARRMARDQSALGPELLATVDLARLRLRQDRAGDARKLLESLDPALEERPTNAAVLDARDLLETVRKRLSEPAAATWAKAPPTQQIRFCAAGDGTRIAYSETGSGRPLVKAGNWLTHLEFDWQSPIWQPLFAEMAASCRLVRYDPRGTGLSDRTPPEIVFDRWVDDLEAVADACGLEQFALFGLSQGAAVSIAYAARHPDRVSHLILLNGYCRGRIRRGVAGAEDYMSALTTLIRQGWGEDHSAHRQMFGALLLPEGNAEQMQWFAELEKVSASPESAAQVCEVAASCDVSGLLAQVKARTLVFHSRRDAFVPLEEGQTIAAGIPGAHFVLLDSCNHLLLPEEPEWPRLIREIRQFLTDPG